MATANKTRKHDYLREIRLQMLVSPVTDNVSWSFQIIYPDGLTEQSSDCYYSIDIAADVATARYAKREFNYTAE
jgi:hypothetical protein